MRKPVESTVERDVGFGEQTAQRREDLVRLGAPFREPQTERLELVPVPAGSDAEDEAALRERGQRLNLAGERERVVVGEHEHAGGETNAGCYARGIRQTEQRGHPGGAIMPRDHEMFADPKGIEAERFGALGEVADASNLIKREVRPGVRREVDAELHFGLLLDERVGLAPLGYRPLGLGGHPKPASGGRVRTGR